MGFLKDMAKAVGDADHKQLENEHRLRRNSDNPLVRDLQYQQDKSKATGKVLDKYTNKMFDKAGSLLKKGTKAGFNKLKEHHAAQKK